MEKSSEEKLIKLVNACFNMAEEMCGSHAPDEIDDDKQAVNDVRAEVVKRVRALAKVERTIDGLHTDNIDFHLLLRAAERLCV